MYESLFSYVCWSLWTMGVNYRNTLRSEVSKCSARINSPMHAECEENNNVPGVKMTYSIKWNLQDA